MYFTALYNLNGGAESLKYDFSVEQSRKRLIDKVCTGTNICNSPRNYVQALENAHLHAQIIKHVKILNIFTSILSQ